jgi:hypothetical protein
MASFEDLPDEIILKVIYFIKMKDLIKFGHVSKRMRAISSDKSLWLKMNLSKCAPGRGNYAIDVPIDFLKMVIKNGCRYLRLQFLKLGSNSMKSEGDLHLDEPSSLRYLELECCEGNVKTFEEILASCHSLQKLSISFKSLTSNMIKSIWYQNGHSLQTLNLTCCDGLDLESIQKITKNCVELKNVNLPSTKLSMASINFLVTNLTPKVEKINLGYLWNLKDEHIKVLLARCNKLSVLILRYTSITNDSLMHIIENLQHTLEKLDVYMCDAITYAKLTELKSMPKLQVLNFWGSDHEKGDLLTLMPFVKFDEIITADERKLLSADGIWDVEVKQLQYFKKLEKYQIQELEKCQIQEWPNKIIFEEIW